MSTDALRIPVNLEKVHNAIVLGQFGPNGSYLLAKGKDNKIISDEDIVAAIIISNGYVNAAAKMLGISVTQINNRKKFCDEIENAIQVSRLIHSEKLMKIYSDGMLNGELQTTTTTIDADGKLKQTVSFKPVDTSTRMYHLQKFLERQQQSMSNEKESVNIENAVIVVSDPEKQTALLDAIKILKGE